MERSSVERTEAKSVLRKVTNHGVLEFRIDSCNRVARVFRTFHTNFYEINKLLV